MDSLKRQNTSLNNNKAHNECMKITWRRTQWSKWLKRFHARKCLILFFLVCWDTSGSPCLCTLAETAINKRVHCFPKQTHSEIPGRPPSVIPFTKALAGNGKVCSVVYHSVCLLCIQSPGSRFILLSADAICSQMRFSKQYHSKEEMKNMATLQTKYAKIKKINRSANIEERKQVKRRENTDLYMRSVDKPTHTRWYNAGISPPHIW